MHQAIVLGAGMVGSVMAADLALDPEFEVTIADARPEALERAQETAQRFAGAAKSAPRTLRTLRADLADTRALSKAIAPFDIVLGALASPIGFQTLRTVIEAGKNFCDICFMPEDFLEFDGLARSRGVTAVVDCGVAPGMSNMVAGHAAAVLRPCRSISIYVGGLPRERRWPFEYKAAFSPFDVIEEYTRPARLVERGEVVVREALSEPELLDFPGIGTLEAFNTDGLRSLATTLRSRVAFMKEKTMRYPGHIELMRVLRHVGLFSHEPVRVGVRPGAPAESGTLVRPIDVTSALLFPRWTYEPGEEDLTVMRIEAEGDDAATGAARRLRYELLDFFDAGTGATSMSRTTAFPCTIMARLVARGEFTKKGVIPPEVVGEEPGMLDRILGELGGRGVRYGKAG
jgi:saccharopine dehydrogenase-like NADP-dependent oxidoreductase